MQLLQRLTVALIGGVLIAGAFGWYLSRRITRPVLALSDAADAIARGSYEVELPPVPSGDEIGHLAERFREMAQRLAESEQLERNFLMSVSHELRTPLTAIRGHVAALAEGILDDAESRQESLEVVEREAARLERLVGDVLDLAKLDAHRFTVTDEEVDMGRLCDQAFAAFQDRARARPGLRRRIEERPDDRQRRRPRAPDHLQPARERDPLDARRRPRRARRSEETGRSVTSASPTRGRHQKAEQERIFRPFWSRDTGGTGLGLAIARSWPSPSADGSSSKALPAKGAGSALVLPAGRRARAGAGRDGVGAAPAPPRRAA